MTVFEGFRRPGARGLLAVVLRPTDPEQDDIEVVHAISDGLLWSDAGDNPASTAFENVISSTSGFKIEEALTRPGTLTGPSRLVLGSIQVLATDAQAQTWPGLDWHGKSCEVYLGLEERLDGTRMPFAEFLLLGQLTIDDLVAVGGGMFEVHFVDQRLVLEEPWISDVYMGFGGAFLIGPAASLHLAAPHDPAMDLTTELQIDWRGRLTVLQAPSPATAHVPLVMNGANNPMGVNWGLFVDSTGTVLFASGSEVVASTFQLTVGTPAFVSVQVTGGTEVAFFASNGQDSPAAAGTATLAAPLAAGPTDGIQMGQPSGSSYELWEARVWSQAQPAEDLATLATSTVADALSRVDLVEAWRAEEGVVLGANPVLGEKGVVDFAVVGAGQPTWMSTLEGDSPDLFPGSPAGRSKPATVGSAFNVPMQLVDTQRGKLAWDHVATGGLNQLRHKGVPMVQSHTVSAASAGDISFDAATNEVVLAPGVGSFSPFIPGQADPSRLGQRVRITNAAQAANRGVFRVAVAGVSADGRRLKVAGRTLVNETGGATVTVASYAPDVQYSVDAATSTATLVTVPEGDLTGDPVGRLPVSGVARWSEVFELLVGVAPDTSAVTFDPVVAFHVKTGDRLSLLDILNALAQSAFGWWVEDLQGGYRLGTFVPPAGGGRAVDDTVLDSVEMQRSEQPYDRLVALYRRNWSPQSEGGLLGSVSQRDKMRYGNEWSSMSRNGSREHDPFELWLPEDADARRRLELTATMLGIKRSWVVIRSTGLGLGDLLPGGEVTVTWSDLTMQLVDTPVRLTHRVLGASPYRVELGGYT